MKFIISSTYLAKQLQLLGGVINNNNTLPILDNFLFQLEDGKLSLTASDLETTMTTVLDVEGSEPGSIAVPARLLLDILKAFPEQPLTFLTHDNGQLEITADAGKYALAYVSGEEFPKPVELDVEGSVNVTGDLLATAISKTLFAAGNDDLRPMMSGVYFQLAPDGLTFVATDAHKLVKYTRTDASADAAADFIMPKKPLNLLKNLLGGSEDEVSIEYTESNARFTYGQTTLVCRLIDAKYPNYQAVIPQENPNKLVISRSLFLQSVRRVSIFASKTTHQVRLSLAGSDFNIKAEDVDFASKAEERLTADYNGDDLQIGFNSRFLVEMLNNLESNDVMLEMSLANRAGILTPVDGLEDGEQVMMLVMPVMLNG